MATVDQYVIDMKVTGEQQVKTAIANTDKLSGSLKDMNEKFESAKSKAEQFAIAIVGIGMIEYIRSTMDAAAKTKDLAEAYGLTIESILELKAGFQTAGRDADAMSKMMTTLALSANSTADGNLKTRNSFADLGITFKDLTTLSMDQVFVKIAKTMAANAGDSQKLAAAMDILGKSAKGLPWGDFITGTDRAKGKMGEAAEATEKLDKVVKQLEASSAAVRKEFTILLAPLADVFTTMTEGSNNAKAAAVGLAAVMAIFAGAGIAKGITVIYEAYKSLAVILGITTVETAAETVALSSNTVAQVENAAVRAAGLSAKVASLQASLANARAVLAETAAEEANLLISAELTAARRILMIQTSQLAAAQAMLAETTVVANTALKGAAVSAYAAGGAFGFLMTKLGPIAIALTVLASAYEMYNVYSKKGSDDNANAIEEATEKLKELGKQNDSVLDKNRKQLDLQAAANKGLLDQYEMQTLLQVQNEKRLQLQLQLIGAGEVEKTNALASYDAQAKRQQEIVKIINEIERVRIQAANDPEGAGKYAQQLTILQSQYNVLVKQVDKTAELVTEIKKAEIADSNRAASLAMSAKISDEVLKKQYEINQLSMTGDQQKVSSLREQIELEGRAEIRRRESVLGRGQTLPFEEQKRVMDEVAQKYKPLIEATDELIKKSRQFATGWSQAFNQAMDDATNAAKVGRDSFNAIFNSMNSAIDTFVMTGKFKFQDFAVSIIQDLLKIELKASAMKLWGVLGGGGGGAGASAGGLFAGIASLFGFAEGGEPPVNKPSIVGEKGPEVFIPKTSGTIIPNDKLIGGQTTHNNTYVTNNISAVDGASVARLLTQNRQIILGAVSQAQKEMPMAIVRGR